MESQKNSIVILSGAGGNNAINGLMTSIMHIIKSFEYNVEYFDLSQFDAELSNKFFNIMSSNTVKFALTYLGIGQDLQVTTTKTGNENIWEFFNVPLLKLHGDTPAYYFERHRDVPCNAVNLYGCEEFLEFHQQLDPDSLCVSTKVDPWIISDKPDNIIDFIAREKGKLYYIKNGGGGPNELIKLWNKNLPPEIVKQLMGITFEILSASLETKKSNIHHFVAAYLLEQKIDTRKNKSLLCFYVAQMDDYLRRIKSTMLARALLPFPVIIQGHNWDHLDTRDAVATLLPGEDFSSTESIYETSLGIIDMSPNIDTSCHDRMMRAAGTYAFAMTNKSSWLNNLLPELNDVAYAFHADQIREAVNDALKNPARCVELGRQYGRAFRERYLPCEFVDRLSVVAEMSRLCNAKPKPELQSYMVW